MDLLRGAGSECRVFVAIEDGTDQSMRKRMRQRVDNRAVFNQALDHNVLAGLIDVDHADMTELAINVTNSGNGGAVVGMTAHEHDIA